MFLKGRSQLSTALYETIKTNPDTPILLLTATPIRSNPWNLHTLLCFYGHYIDWKDWRKQFFSLERRPYLSRLAWIPKPDWRIKVREVLEKYADIVLLKDCVDELPPYEEKIITSKTTLLENNTNFFDQHRNEQIDKYKEILNISTGYRKVLVVAYYVEQIEDLAKKLSKNRLTFVVHGSTKNQEQVLKEANECDECFLIVQASLGVGWDGDSFSCVIFASMSYAVRDFVQLKGRVRRIHNLHPVIYYYLLAGKCDDAVYNNVQAGKDFIVSEYMYV